MNFKQYLATLLSGLFVSIGLILWNTFGDGFINYPIFIFFAISTFFFSVKFPRRTFLVFVMFLALENIVITPKEFPFSLRPFQLIGAILFLTTFLLGFKQKAKHYILGTRNLLTKKKKAVCELTFFDKLIFVLPIFALLGTFNAPNRALSLKLAIIFFSFIILYWLIRSFVKSREEIVETLLFFVFGSVPVIFWSFYQAFAKLIGWVDFQVFTARVNGTFTEPDWLGVYLVLMLAILLWFRHLAKPDKSDLMVAGFGVSRIFGFFVNLYFIVAFSVLILTVSRSAWLGVFAVYIMYLLILLADKFFHKTFSFVQILKNVLVLGLLSSLAVFVVGFTGLSTFHFGNRAASSISGQQLITISCERNTELPYEIRTMDELDIFGCRHIDLEEVKREKMNKMFVTTIMRPDPNISIRKEIYAKTFKETKKHLFLGQGLGSAASFLGTDDHGSGLNTSNIVLEILLSMGIFAAIFSIFIIGKLISWSLARVYNVKNHIFSSLILLSGVAIIIPNMFNAGLLMGMFWFWLAIVVCIYEFVRNEK